MKTDFNLTGGGEGTITQKRCNHKRLAGKRSGERKRVKTTISRKEKALATWVRVLPVVYGKSAFQEYKKLAIKKELSRVRRGFPVRSKEKEGALADKP